MYSNVYPTAIYFIKKKLESIASSSSFSESLRLTMGNQTLLFIYLLLLLLFECDYRAYPDLAIARVGFGFGSCSGYAT